MISSVFAKQIKFPALVIQRRIFAVFSVFVLLLSSDFFIYTGCGWRTRGIFYIANVRATPHKDHLLDFAHVLIACF